MSGPEDAGTGIVTTRTPAYGTTLVNIPGESLPIAVNCVCTDRADGEYSIGGNIGSSSSVLYRDIAGWLNKNPLEAPHLQRVEPGEGESTVSWLASGKPISSVVCEKERIKMIK